MPHHGTNGTTQLNFHPVITIMDYHDTEESSSVSFFKEEDLEDIYSGEDAYSGTEASADEMVCLNCGGTDFHVAGEGGGNLVESVDLICSNCFTQSQKYDSHNDEDEVMKLAAKTRFGGYIGSEQSARKRKRKKIILKEYGVTLPGLEACLEAFQAVLKAAAKIAVKLAGISNEDAVVDMCGKLWIGFLRSWVKSANHYGKLYPEVNFCMRDMFLPSNVKYLMRLHSGRRLKQENDTDAVDGTSREDVLLTNMENESGLADRDEENEIESKSYTRSSSQMQDAQTVLEIDTLSKAKAEDDNNIPHTSDDLGNENSALVIVEENDVDGSDDDTRMALNQNSVGTASPLPCFTLCLMMRAFLILIYFFKICNIFY